MTRRLFYVFSCSSYKTQQIRTICAPRFESPFISQPISHKSLHLAFFGLHALAMVQSSRVVWKMKNALTLPYWLRIRRILWAFPYGKRQPNWHFWTDAVNAANCITLCWLKQGDFLLTVWCQDLGGGKQRLLWLSVFKVLASQSKNPPKIATAAAFGRQENDDKRTSLRKKN